MDPVRLQFKAWPGPFVLYASVAQRPIQKGEKLKIIKDPVSLYFTESFIDKLRNDCIEIYVEKLYNNISGLKCKKIDYAEVGIRYNTK